MKRKKTKYITVVLLAAMLTVFPLSGCSNDGEAQSSQQSSANNASELIASLISDDTASNISGGSASASSGESKSIAETAEFFTERDLSGEYDESEAAKITLSDSEIKIDGDGAQAKDGVVTISKEGTYIISGTLSDGTVLVDAGDSDKVQLVLDGCSISCSDYSAICVNSADKVFITLTKGTENSVSDGKTYSAAKDGDNADAAIFSKSDLVINGEGTLTVTGNMSHAVVSKDDLKITSGTIKINSTGSAVCGKDSVRIANAVIDVTSGGDGIKSTNSEDNKKGYVYIESGSLTITSENDAIQSESSLIVLDAEITATTGGSSSNSAKSHAENFGGWGGWNDRSGSAASSDEDASSAKGLKSGGSLAISGAAITLDCADDAVHSGGSTAIEGGTVSLKSGDDGIHAEESVTISGGDTTIAYSYEGVEGKNVTISGGKLDVTADDDGINASDGISEGGMPGRQTEQASSDVFLLISGGEVHVNAAGDGLDSNGTFTVSGGTVYVDGPTNDGNGALDSGSGCIITGGTVVAVGSSGMAETFGESSTQGSILCNLSESHSAGETVTLTDSSGNEIISYTAAKIFSSVVISTPAIKSGETYTLKAGSTEYEIKMTSLSYSNGQSGTFGGPGGQPNGQPNGRMGRF